MKGSFVHGAFVLMAAAAVNRIMGFIYQALIFRLIGAEGVGLFNLVYPVYILIIVVATAGIPLGVSKLVSEEKAGGNYRGCFEILSLSVLILTASGIVFSIGSYLIFPLLMEYVFINKMVGPVFLSLLPGVLIVSISSAFRGFFQGLMDMVPPAVSQVVEQVIRILTGLVLAVTLLPLGLEWAAAGIAAAGVIGELAGLMTLLGIFLRQKPIDFRIILPTKVICCDILGKLFHMCTPVTMGRIASAIMLSVDSVLIPLMLKKAGYTTSSSTAIYGLLTGVAMTLLFVPSVFTISLATSLVPAISEAAAQKRRQLISARTSEAIRVTILASIPFTAAYLTLSSEISLAIFSSAQGGELLRALAFGGILAYLQQTTTGILQGLGKPVVPLRHLVVGGFIKILGILVLTPQPELGIMGTVYSYNLFFLLTACLNLLSLYEATGFTISFKNNVLKPVAAGGVTAITLVWSHSALCTLTSNNPLGTAVSLALGFTVYLAITIFMGAVRKSDLSRLPFFKTKR